MSNEDRTDNNSMLEDERQMFLEEAYNNGISLIRHLFKIVFSQYFKYLSGRRNINGDGLLKDTKWEEKVFQGSTSLIHLYNCRNKDKAFVEKYNQEHGDGVFDKIYFRGFINSFAMFRKEELDERSIDINIKSDVDSIILDNSEVSVKSHEITLNVSVAFIRKLAEEAYLGTIDKVYFDKLLIKFLKKIYKYEQEILSELDGFTKTMKKNAEIISEDIHQKLSGINNCDDKSFNLGMSSVLIPIIRSCNYNRIRTYLMALINAYSEHYHVNMGDIVLLGHNKPNGGVEYLPVDINHLKRILDSNEGFDNVYQINSHGWNLLFCFRDKLKKSDGIKRVRIPENNE